MKHRRRAAVRRHRRRRHNPALGGFKLPNLTTAAVAVAGAVGSKWIVKRLPANLSTGMVQPLAILGVGMGLGFALKFVKMGKFSDAVVMGSAVAAGLEAVKLTPLGAQLGEYFAPRGYTPVVGEGVGALPSGFMNQSDLAAGSDQFMNEADLF